jgi:glycyl-tRNA synthetase beta chain
MPELLLELGCEELPASFVKKAYRDLAQAVAARLEEAGIPFQTGHPPIGTPRRLIVHFAEIAEKQPDRTKEARGPSKQAAFDAEGKPTKALEGFCRAQGVSPDQARVEGDYVWVTQTLPGKPTREALQEILPEAIRSLSFDKTMRWGEGRLRFARPIRWILASLGGELVPFSVEGVASALESRGHRFDHPEPFPAATYDELLDGLILRHVEPDSEERARRIREGAAILATGEPEIEPALLEENVFLTEWPSPLEGGFREEYLELPEPVLVTAMAKHEKMFPVRDRDGKLLPRFVFVRNSGDEATVRAGAEWVLNARFNDAKFFFEEDKKRSLGDFLEKTSGILFQEKLGTVRQRADRLSALAAEAALHLPFGDAEAGPERELALVAGKFAKADLSSGLVSELASLQGIVGGEYARREGLPDDVARAIARHYDLSKSLEGGKVRGDAASRTAVRTLVADQLDKLAGYLGLGIKPSGSSDPFGLRRAATLLIEAAWAWPEWAPGYDLFLLPAALRGYREQGLEFDEASVHASFREIMAARYESLLEDRRPDLVEATRAWAAAPMDARTRLRVLEELVEDRAFVQTATRPLNILEAAKEKGQWQEPAPGWEQRLDSPDGAALLERARAAKSELADASIAQDVERTAAALKSLEEPVVRFFESTMVMAEQAEVRQARLSLVAEVAEALRFGGDFAKIVQEG